MSKQENAFLRAAARRNAPTENYNSVDLKHAMEQAIRDLFYHEFKYTENHKDINVHLVFGYIAAISSISSAWYSYTHPFQELLTKYIIIVGCSVYFICSAVLLAYKYFIKKDIIYRGYSNNKSVQVSIINNKYSSDFILQFEFKNTKSAVVTHTVKPQVGRWFTTKGELVAQHFMDDIKSAINKKL